MDKYEYNKKNQDEGEETSEETITPVYVDFEDLVDFDDSEIESCEYNLVKILKDDKIETWLPQFNAIVDLRRLLKFRRKEFLKAFNVIYKNFVRQINSLRSSCSKISLILLYELFSSVNYDIHNEWIEAILPTVLAKTTFIQKFIKEEAFNVLNNCSKNIFYYSVLDILVQNIGNKNIHISDVAFEHYNQLIQNWNYTSLLKLNDLYKIFPKIIEIYKIKKDPYSKRAIKIIGILYEKIGKQNFGDLLNKAGGEIKIQVTSILKLANVSDKGNSDKEYEKFDIISPKKNERMKK